MAKSLDAHKAQQRAEFEGVTKSIQDLDQSLKEMRANTDEAWIRCRASRDPKRPLVHRGEILQMGEHRTTYEKIHTQKKSQKLENTTNKLKIKLFNRVG